MNDRENENGLSISNDKKSEIARQMADTEMRLAPLDIEIDTSKGYKLPLDQIPALVCCVCFYAHCGSNCCWRRIGSFIATGYGQHW